VAGSRVAAPAQHHTTPTAPQPTALRPG
jgi:hypothetical protein